MFKYKKMIFYFSVLMFIVLSLVELVIYLFSDNTIFGMYYLFINLLIVFLLVPTAYNYNKYYSVQRISKIIIAIILGIINSYFLQLIIMNSVIYIDGSHDYIKEVFIYRVLLKTLVYLILITICVFEFKNERKISSIHNK